MIKTIDQIELIDIAKMERTGRVSHFKMWYNFLPSKLFIKKISNLVNNQFFSIINNGISDETDEIIKLDDLEYYVKLKIEVNQLRAIEMLFFLLLGRLTTLLRIKSMIRGRKLRKITEKPDQLAYACKKAKEISGIEINNLRDISKFKEWVKYRCEKLSDYENMKLKETEDKKKDGKVYIIRYAIRIMNYLEKSLEVEKIKCSVFLEYNAEAMEKAERQKNNNQNNE